MNVELPDTRAKAPTSEIRFVRPRATSTSKPMLLVVFSFGACSHEIPPPTRSFFGGSGKPSSAEGLSGSLDLAGGLVFSAVLGGVGKRLQRFHRRPRIAAVGVEVAPLGGSARVDLLGRVGTDEVVIVGVIATKAGTDW